MLGAIRNNSTKLNGRDSQLGITNGMHGRAVWCTRVAAHEGRSVPAPLWTVQHRRHRSISCCKGEEAGLLHVRLELMRLSTPSSCFMFN